MFQFMNTHTYVGLQQTHLLFVYGLKEAYKQKERSINWLPNFKSKNIYVPENVLWWGTYKCPYSKWWITMYKRPRPRQDSFLKFLWASRYLATTLLCRYVKGASSRGVPLANMAMQGRRSSANLSGCRPIRALALKRHDAHTGFHWRKQSARLLF